MTQIYPSKQSVDMFKKQVKIIEKSWFNTDDNDVDATNELMCDMINEIDHFLRDYSTDMGN